VLSFKLAIMVSMWLYSLFGDVMSNTMMRVFVRLLQRSVVSCW